MSTSKEQLTKRITDLFDLSARAIADVTFEWEFDFQDGLTEAAKNAAEIATTTMNEATKFYSVENITVDPNLRKELAENFIAATDKAIIEEYANQAPNCEDWAVKDACSAIKIALTSTLIEGKEEPTLPRPRTLA